VIPALGRNMKKTHFFRLSRSRRESGAVAVEFALGLLAFMTLLLGSLQAMTYAYQLGMAGLATEQGARAAAMCTTRDSASLAGLHGRALTVMQGYLPGLQSGEISVTVQPTGCGSSSQSCEGVTLSLNSSMNSGYQVPAWAPFAVSMPLPAAALRTSRPFEMPVTTC